MVDNETLQIVSVDLWPLRLDVMLKAGPDRHLAIAWLAMQIGAAAEQLWPEFNPERVKPRYQTYPIIKKAPVEGPSVPFRPVWRRRRFNHDDEGG